jgi:sugar-specific transcriptional regulator TrmB
VTEPGGPFDWKRLVDSLGRFGLAPREAAVYLALLRQGRATASELARASGVDRVLGYRILEAMRSQGLVEMTAERPRRYSPVAPATWFERVLRERRGSLAQDEALARELGRQLEGLARAETTGGPRYQVLVGEARIYDYLREMVGRARQEIAVMLTRRSLNESLRAGLQDEIGGFLRSGGAFRLIVEADPRVRLLELRLRRTVRRFPKAGFREVVEQPTRMTVVDRSEAIVFLVPEARDRGAEQAAIWSDSAPFVAGQRAYFETVWSGASPLALPTRR